MNVRHSLFSDIIGSSVKFLKPESQTLLQRRVLGPGYKQKVNQLHNVTQRDVLITGRSSAAILIHVRFRETRLLAAIVGDKQYVDQQHDVTQRNLVRIGTKTIGIAHSPDTAFVSLSPLRQVSRDLIPRNRDKPPRY